MTAIAVVVVALTALGHRHRPTGGSAEPGAAQVLTDAQYMFAVGGDRNPTASGRLLFRADQVLRARCMKNRGFQYVTAPAPTAGASVLPSTTGYPSTFYPQPSVSAYPQAKLLALRRRHGFGIYDDAVSRHTNPDPNDRYLNTLPPPRQQQWLTAWTGNGGCYGSAEVQLYGSRRAANMEQLVSSSVYNYLNTVAYDQAGKISRRNPRTATAASAWTRCMQRATGQRWSDENALINWLDTNYSSRQRRARAFRQLEIERATTDTQCAYSTGQAQTFAAVFRGAADHLPTNIARQLRFVLAHRPVWVAQARKILSSQRASG